MSAVAAIVALPVAALTIWALLRNGLGGRLVAAPSGDRWHDARRRRSAASASSSASLAGIGACARDRRDRADVGARQASPAARDRVRRGLIDDVRSLPPLAKLGGAVRRRGRSCSHRASASRSSTTTSLAHRARPAVARRRSRTPSTSSTTWTASPATPRRRRGALLRDRRRHGPRRTTSARRLARARARLRRLPALQLPAAEGRAAVFMGDSGSQVIGFALAALGLATSWKVAGTTVATLILPLLVLAVPILDTALVTVVRLARGPADPPGRPRPHVAPARLLRPLREGHGRPAARADRRRRSARRASPTRARQRAG